MGFFDFLFGKKKKMTLDEANEVNKDFVKKNPEAKDNENALMRQASSFLTSGRFEEAAKGYTELANAYPEKKGLYLSQVGAAYYFLKQYDKAIANYVESRNNGMDEDMIDDNIWEACEAIHERDGSTDTFNTYLKHCPNGSYAKKAKKFLA